MFDSALLNFPAILVASLASFVLGFLWHGPVFGKQWMKLMKITAAEMKKGKKEMAKKMPLYLIVAFLQQVITATAIAFLVLMLEFSDATSAIILAVWIWLGFIATTLLNGVLWEKRSIPLYLFNITYQLVSLVVITLIVGLWQ